MLLTVSDCLMYYGELKGLRSVCLSSDLHADVDDLLSKVILYIVSVIIIIIISTVIHKVIFVAYRCSHTSSFACPCEVVRFIYDE